MYPPLILMESLMVITIKKKLIVDTKKDKEKNNQSLSLTKNHQTTKEDSMKEREEQKNYKQKTINKIAVLCSYLSIITSNENRLNSLIKRQSREMGQKT